MKKVFKLMLGAILSFVAVWSALGAYNSFLFSYAVPDSEYLLAVSIITGNVIIAALSGYWALRLFGVLKRRGEPAS